MDATGPAGPSSSLPSLATLELLYDAYHGQAMAVAWSVLRDREDAEEVVQEAFLSARCALDRYDPSRGSTRTWLLSLVRNQAIDVLRAQKRRPTQPIDGSEPSDPADVPTLAAATIDGETALAALQCLPAEQRQAIELAYFAGLTHREIASRLTMPVGTVKSRIRLALDRLRLALDAAGEHGESTQTAG